MVMKRKINLVWAIAILHIGDSHSVGPFGRELNRELRALPDTQVSFYASCGAVATSFFNGWTTPCGYFQQDAQGAVIDVKSHSTARIEPLLAQLHPSLTLVELSTNYFLGWGKERAIQDMEHMATVISQSGSDCLWISGPDTRRFHSQQGKMLDWVKTAVGSKCQVIDGSATTSYPDQGDDGIHYGRTKTVQAWVDQVITEVKKKL